MASYELYGARRCPYTEEMRDWLELQGRDFVEYDVDADIAALRRLHAACAEPLTIPVLVEDGRVVQVGWQGRGCTVSAPRS